MSNTEKIHKYTTNCINCLPVVFIARPNENNGVQIVMIGISEEQEKKLINNENVVIETDRGTFNISPDFCYAYGEIDLSPNSPDIIKLYEGNPFDNLNIRISVPAEYEYENHCIISSTRGGTWYNTSNIKDYLPYLHGCIGKPKRIAIFKECLNALIAKKLERERRNRNNKIYREHKSDYNYNKEKTIAKRKAKVSSLKFKIKK